MGWLGTRLRKKPSEAELLDELEADLELDSEPSGPALVLLIPEIAGGSTYRLHRLYDVAEATTLLESTIPPIRAGIHAFWALDEQPVNAGPSDRGGEAMVLIRSRTDSDTVYVVSFVDIESAASFARFEVKRGLDLGLVMVYWASLVEIDQTGAGWTLSPSEPPVSNGASTSPGLRHRGGFDSTARIAFQDSTGMRKSTRAGEEADAARERYRHDEASAAGMVVEETEDAPAPQAFDIRRMRRDGPPVSSNGKTASIEDAQPEPAAVEDDISDRRVETFAGDEEVADRILQEALGDSDINLNASEQPEAQTTQPDTTTGEPELDLFNSSDVTSRSKKGRKNAGPAPEAISVSEELTEPAPASEASTETEVEERAATVEALLEPPAVDEAVAEDAPVEVEEPPEVTREPAVAAASFDSAQPVAPAAAEDSEPDEVTSQVEKILRIPRWEKREDPFKGFNSPPGRF